jgi:phage tail sheath protein FI
MPVNPTYPGVYVQELPSGVRTISGVATSITAFVGFTPKGPVNEAVHVLSPGDYERTFGGLHPDSEIAFAVQQFFLNGGSDAYVVRVAVNAAPATVTLRYGGTPGLDALVVSALDEGVWGNLVRLDVDFDTANRDSLFNLSVTRYELQAGKLVPVETEQHRNLSMNSRSSTYAQSVVNAASRIVQVTRAPGIAFADRGYSLSGSLNPFPALAAGDQVLTGFLDGVDPFTLMLAGAPPATLADLRTAVQNAIAAAGLGTRLEAVLADPDGTDNAGGACLKLRSLKDPANPSTVEEYSSVQVLPAPAGDLSGKIKMGLSRGGREREGAASRRPVPCGTLGGDLSTSGPVAGSVSVAINDNSTGAPVAILPVTVAGDIAPATPVGPALRDRLQQLIRALPSPAAQSATVELWGSVLRVLPSASTPNASIVLSGPGAVAAGLSGGEEFVNVEEYSLGTGAAFGAQAGAAPGADGTAPTNAAAILGDQNAKTGIYALLNVDLFNLLVIPRTTLLPDTQAKAVIAAAIALCEDRRAFFIVDPDPTKTLDDLGTWASEVGANKNAALYYPQVQIANPLDGYRLAAVPSSGTLAGLYARTDAERGVWKAPAGTDAVLQGVQGLTDQLTDAENGVLNPLGINVLRNFPVYGMVSWGARTMQGDDRQASEWKYVPVRRLALYLEESLYRGTKWVVFEPNDEPLWAQIRLNVGAFLQTLFRQGAFQGQSPREAYFVKCDKETTTQDDINRGVVNIVVGFAPLKPAEFVIISLQQIAGQGQA